MSYFPRAALLLCYCAALALSGCSKDSEALHFFNRLMMGTLVELTLRGPGDKASATAEAVFREFKRIEDLTSFHKDSALSRVNDSAGKGSIAPGPELFALLVESLRLARETGGTFDPTIGPVCRLWQFSGGEPRVPEPSEIAEAVRLVGWHRVRINHETGTLELPEAGMSFDLGGISKGYALARAADLIRKSGLVGGLVNAGGDVAVIGEKAPGQPWKIGVQAPRNEKGIVAVATLKDTCIFTSGDYERVLFKDGKRYHHILIPETGYPATACQSVTIVAQDAVLADALAKAVFIMGPEKGITFLESFPDVRALVIDAEGKTHGTAQYQSLFELVSR